MNRVIRPKESYWGFDVKQVEKVYKAKFVGDFCVKTKHGWSEQPVSVFYQKNPPKLSPEGRPCSNYLGLYYQGQVVMICDAQSAFSEGIVGSVANNGDVIYSSHRHDFKYSEDGTSMVDGGRDYTKTNGCLTVMLKIEGDKLVIDEGT